MMKNRDVHTVPAGESPGWWNKRNGRIVSRHRTKEDAVEAGREMARKLKVEHTIHRRDGVITEKNSYGNDPCPPKDAR
jgi:hypothetical protein